MIFPSSLHLSHSTSVPYRDSDAGTNGTTALFNDKKQDTLWLAAKRNQSGTAQIGFVDS
jgi:hypothetical protein